MRRRLAIIDFFLRLGTLLLPTFAFGIASYIRFVSGIIPIPSGDIPYSDYFGLLLFTTIVWAIVIEHYGFYRFDLLFQSRSAVRAAFLPALATYMSVTAATFFYRTASFSRLFVAISGAVLFPLALLMHRVFDAILERAIRHGKGAIRLLVVGADQYAARIASLLKNVRLVPCTVTAFVRLPGQEVAVPGDQVVQLDDLRTLAIDSQIDDAVLAVAPGQLDKIPGILAELEQLCVPVRAVLDLGDSIVIREKLFYLGNVAMVDVRATAAESVMYVVLKRALDLTLSAVALILAAPLMAAIAVAVRLSSPGPVLFKQQRVGLNGRLFDMYKFRTMRLADTAESDTRWTTANDPRRTRLGAFLRRTNFDELPQFFNVIKGEMSIVGPRPERPHFVRKFLDEVARYNRRHYLKAGITGWAQVNGWRGDTSISERVAHDLYYLQNWSLAFDLRIILLTVVRIFSSKNAY